MSWHVFQDDSGSAVVALSTTETLVVASLFGRTLTPEPAAAMPVSSTPVHRSVPLVLGPATLTPTMLQLGLTMLATSIAGVFETRGG